MIIAGDIGGTKIDLAICERRDSSLKCIEKQRFETAKFTNLTDVLREFLSGKSMRGISSCFGVAGPVEKGKCHLVNIDWMLDAKQIQKDLEFASTWLINDLEAIAFGVGALQDDDFVILNQGCPKEGNAAVAAAGTGLGESGLYWDGKTHHPFASEGGHCNFAPRNELEIGLLRYLTQRFGHVSYERIVSGPGLFNIYQFLRDAKKMEEPAWLKDEILQQDPPTVVTRHALDASSELCVQALDLFISNYGSEGGNLALKYLAHSGVYLGGGIAPRIIHKLQEGAFMDAFKDKGRFKELLERIPVKVINNKDTSLLGAARYVLLNDHKTLG